MFVLPCMRVDATEKSQIGLRGLRVRVIVANGFNYLVVVPGLGLVSLMVPGAAMQGRVHFGLLVSGLVRAIITT